MAGRGAKFWWDRVKSDEKSANGDAELVAAGLAGSFDSQAVPELRRMILNKDNRYAGLLIPPNYAFFMRGTTAELTDALIGGFRTLSLSFFLLHDQILIRYFRKQHPAPLKMDVFTETFLGIGGYSYWGDDQLQRPRPPERKGWRNLAWSYRQHLRYGVKPNEFMLVKFDWLVTTALPRCKIESEVGEVSWTQGDTQEFPTLPPLFPSLPQVFPSLPPAPNNHGD